MYSKPTRSLYQKISNKVLNIDNIKKDSNKFNLIKNFISSTYFISSLDDLIRNDDYDCNSILLLFQNLINEIDPSEKDWLNIIYQYTLFKSFPHAVNINITKNIELISNIYLEVLRIFSQKEKVEGKNNINSKYPLTFLSFDEQKQLKNSREYRKFRKAFSNKFVYEMMQLNQYITGHNTLDHVSGVHHLAMHIAKQLKEMDFPIDLGRVSGAGAGHDIGKFGCVGDELKRVAYFHYYYTDLWFKKSNIPYIGHIAANHSTWDLELENLPLESLVLIYSDFRVKNRKNKNNKREMHIFSLKDSFNIILDKLDNVDEAKEKRYKRVYAKLKDFEDYIKYIGVNVDFEEVSTTVTKNNHYSLMENQDVIDSLKHLAINHNINLLYKLRNESSLNDILNKARSSRDWKKLRAYLNVFEEYSTYLTQNQKLITINFLYELLTHKEGDIRKQSAALIGTFISMFDEEYRKEIPKNATIDIPYITSKELLDRYLKLFLYPDHKIIELHREWITFSLRIMLASLFSNSSKAQKDDYVEVLYKYYRTIDSSDNNTQFYLLQTIKYIPLKDLEDNSLIKMFDFIIKLINSENSTLRISALERVYNLLFRINRNSEFVKKLKNELIRSLRYSTIPAENFIKYKIVKKLDLHNEIISEYFSNFKLDYDKTSDVFLKNLKSATSWIIKKINIELLLEQVIEDPNNNVLHCALHLCNLLKVSAVENVRHHAGEALIKITPFLSLDQRNDVAIELLRGLEIQGYQFTKYIPNYLGQIMLYLHPTELDELIDDFIDKIKNSSSQVTFLLFRTIGITIQNYPKYKQIFKETEDDYNNRLIKMLGILLNGLVSHEMEIKQEAFSVIGKEIFSSHELRLDEKKDIFVLISKKILTLLPEKEDSELFFLISSASLNHIYKFISDYVFFKNDIILENPKRVAFFPGTFDPFSISHKEIAKAIKNLGFEVHLAVDEFSWSKNTQPHMFRKNIVSMSIAGELDTYVFPDDLPVNISNSDDLLMLKDIFKQSDLYIVVGSDVVLNASSYKNDCDDYCIHDINHIIFDRDSLFSCSEDSAKLDEGIRRIKGDVIRLALPLEFKNISSTQIRDYIDENRDISQLTDPLAQKYIYEYGLYRRESQYKTLIKTKSLDVEIVNDVDDELLNKLCTLFFKNSNASLSLFKKIKSNNLRILLMRNSLNNGEIIGFSAFHWVRSSNLYNEFKSDKVSEYIRYHSVGRIIVINGIFVSDEFNKYSLEQIILTETLSFCLSKDYNYAIYNNIIKDYTSNSINELLKLQGFIIIPTDDEGNPILAVNMNNPCTLTLDVEALIKEPFRSNTNVIKSVQRSRKRLQRALTRLYPGELVLSFDRDMMYRNVTKKICQTNEVPIQPISPRKLGPYMCVPFGSILESEIVPNTITKSLHTEKMFDPDIKGFSIGPYPYYISLENQIKMLKSFKKPVILVDDLLNKGYRIKSIDPLLKHENVNVKKIIVGILSGRGKELMDKQGREVDSAYFIPNLKIWFNENALYPFIGGDTVWRGKYPKINILPSINFVLPYTSPSFIIKSTLNDYIYNLSETAIINSLDIISTLENEYQMINKRSLTLRHLGEVITSPRYPDKGEHVKYDLNLLPSQYLRNDLEHLNRIENIMVSLEE